MRTTTKAIYDKKKRKEKIIALTAYDFPFARIFDQAGIDPSEVLSPIVLQVTLPATESKELLRSLEQTAGISRASIMPTHDNVAKTLELKRDLELW